MTDIGNNPLTNEIIKTLKHKNLIPTIPDKSKIPLPAINKVELYLSFHGNDRCAHCITNSGPHRGESLHPNRAKQVIDNIAKYSILSRLQTLDRGGQFRTIYPAKYEKLYMRPKPPKKLTKEVYQGYADCLMGKNYTSMWINDQRITPLNFGRPSIRISGGEFYTWPHVMDGVEVSKNDRLKFQKDLLKYINNRIPEYDIFILTNGRFAKDIQSANTVIQHWSDHETDNSGRTHICISMDPFHHAPSNSTLMDMLNRIWKACRKSRIGTPLLYGVPNNRIMLLGRALVSFSKGNGKSIEVKDITKNSYYTDGRIELDPVDLIATDGCNELKGFICETEYGAFIANNIVVLPSGHLAYCCACVGNFGDFINKPQETLLNITTNTIAVMLRRKQTAINILSTAVELDPSIKLFLDGKNSAVTGSTCYQMLSGIRIPSDKTSGLL
ncbi:MAG: hypothetical protein SVZ03_14235 [Spirochaetota bacterium]|nr:hypothetical protein [Spirochaetota bacterium]